MSKKWTNPPLTLRPATASSEEGQEQQHSLSTIAVVPPGNANASSLSRRDSTLSDAQYAFAGPSNHYLDLPSAVPFQDFVSPALPSAEFPSSARDFVSPPGTSSTTTGFPDSLPSSDQINHTPKPGNKHQSNNPIPSDHSPPSALSHPIIATPTPGATALSRADSSVSYDSVWSGEGSQQHIALDITQFPRPPDTPSEEPSSARSSPNVPSFNPNRKPTRLKPPVSPLYEESEPSASRPLTPTVGEVSYQYPISTSSQQQSSTSLVQVQDAQDADSLIIQYLRPHSEVGNGLILPSLAPTSARASYQSHVTAASRGSSSPRYSIGEVPARASAGPSTPMAWDNVMNSVKQNWDPSESVRASAPRSTVMSTVSTNAIVGTSITGYEDGLSINAPPVPASNLLSPLSGESSSDVYSAIGRMSFPKPPILPASANDEQSSPISPILPRSTWVTGLTLKTKSSRGSLATPKRRADDLMSPPLSPTIPPMPLSLNSSSADSAVPPLILRSPAEEYANATLSLSTGQRLDVPTESRHSAQSGENLSKYKRFYS